MSIEAMKQALEALEKLERCEPSYSKIWSLKDSARKNITALRAAIEQTEKQEPVTLNRAGVQKLLEQSGYDNANPEEMAAFISGIRHREAEMLDTPPAATAQKGGEA